MNGPPPRVAAAGAYRRLLADEIAEAVTAGFSVVVTGSRQTAEVLDLAAVALSGSGIRVLELRPPLDSDSFVSQFAREWRATSKEVEMAAGSVMLPQASGERFAMLLHQAELIPAETFRHLERLAQAWPGMNMVFAGLPRAAEMVRSNDYPTLANRVSKVIEASMVDELRRLQRSGDALDLAGAVPVQFAPPAPSSRVIAESPAFLVPPRPIAPGPLAGVAAPREAAPPQPRTTLSRVVTFGMAGLVALLITTGTSIPRLSGVAGNAGLDTELKPSERASTVLDGPTAPSSQPPAEPERVVTPASPLQEAAGQGAAVVSIPEVAAPAAETAPAVIEAQQEANPAPVRPEPTGRGEAEEGAGPALQTASNSPTPSLSPVPSLSPAPNPASAPSLSPAMADAMTRRGLAMIAIGDVSAARLLLARAADAGSGLAALAMGTTFDAAALERMGAVGIVPDPARAAAWYRLALGLGEEQARAMLDALPMEVVNAKPKAGP